MPTALVLSLRPQAPATIPRHLGRASHAAFLQALAERDAQLAQRLHDVQGLKPFTASDLLDIQGGHEGRAVQPERTYGLRWTGLSQELDEHLRACASSPPGEVELDGIRFTVEQATTEHREQMWSGTAEWSDLVALERVGREDPPHRFVLLFFSPTTFRSSGRNIPLPLPELVFGSLLDRWNSAAPLPLPVEVRHFASDCLALGRFHLQSEHLALFGTEPGGKETAFTGRCTFVATNRDRYYLHCCAALLRLAFFSGVGAKTSMGLGMVRWEQGS